jgi:hypothetical protein
MPQPRMQRRGAGQAAVLALVIVCLSPVICLSPISGRGQEASPAQPALPTDDWITVSKDYSSQRYVDLDQITPGNVSQLSEVCEINLNEPSWFSSGILKIGRTLYVTIRRMTYAIDGETCALRWRYALSDDALKAPNFGSPNSVVLPISTARSFAEPLTAALFRSTPRPVNSCGRCKSVTKTSKSRSLRLLSLGRAKCSSASRRPITGPAAG